MYLLAKETEKLSRLGIRVFVKPRDPRNKDKKFLASEDETAPTQKDGYFAGSDTRAFAILIAVKNDNGHEDEVQLVIPEGKDGKKLEKFLSPQNHFENQDIFVRLVSTYDVYGGRSTKPQDNNITIISTKKNILQIISVGIVTRIKDNESWHFLVIQEMYKAKLYREKVGGQVAIKDSEYDGYKKWSDLREIVEELAGSRELPALPKTTRAVTTNDDVTVRGLKDNQGQVLFFDIRKGFGMALTKDHPQDGVYFHWKQAETNDRLPYFERGQLITYDTVYENSHGPQLLGVKII